MSGGQLTFAGIPKTLMFARVLVRWWLQHAECPTRSNSTKKIIIRNREWRCRFYRAEQNSITFGRRLFYSRFFS